MSYNRDDGIPISPFLTANIRVPMQYKNDIPHRLTFDSSWNRRKVLGAAWASTMVLSGHQLHAIDAAPTRNRVIAFVKPFSKIPYGELSDSMASMGFDGIEATVRSGGQVIPERVADELPKLCEAMARNKLMVEIATCGVNSLQQPDCERILKTMAQCGIRYYRPAYYRYDLKRPIPEQIELVRKQVAELAAFNREHGLTMLYQNHSGATNFGAPLWDLYSIVKEHSPDQVAVALDLAHTTIEGGLSWPIEARLMRPHTGALFVKDFRWKDRKVEWTPLGKGMIDPQSLKFFLQHEFRGPISLHVEYVDDKDPTHLELYRKAFANDIATLRKWMQT